MVPKPIKVLREKASQKERQQSKLVQGGSSWRVSMIQPHGWPQRTLCSTPRSTVASGSNIKVISTTHQMARGTGKPQAQQGAMPKQAIRLRAPMYHVSEVGQNKPLHSLPYDIRLQPPPCPYQKSLTDNNATGPGRGSGGNERTPGEVCERSRRHTMVMVSW